MNPRTFLGMVDLQNIPSLGAMVGYSSNGMSMHMGVTKILVPGPHTYASGDRDGPCKSYVYFGHRAKFGCFIMWVPKIGAETGP